MVKKHYSKLRKMRYVYENNIQHKYEAGYIHIISWWKWLLHIIVENMDEVICSPNIGNLIQIFRKVTEVDQPSFALSCALFYKRKYWLSMTNWSINLNHGFSTIYLIQNFLDCRIISSNIIHFKSNWTMQIIYINSFF